MTGNQKISERSRARGVAVTGMFVAVVAVCSQVAIPMPTGVPVTLQTMAIALAGYMLGCGRGTTAIAVYIIMGTLGLPVFSNFSGGFGVLFGKTGGFIFGFLPMAACCGLSVRRGNFAVRLAFGILGLAACHAAGAVQFALLSGSGFFASALLVSVPYLIKDIVSVAAACVIADRVTAVLRVHGMRAGTRP